MDYETQVDTESDRKAQKALRDKWLTRVEESKSAASRDMDRIRMDEEIERYGSLKGRTDENRYVVNVTSRHLQQISAFLYARNPTFVCRQRERMEYVLWDENQETLNNAYALVAQTQMMAQQVSQQVSFYGGAQGQVQAQQMLSDPAFVRAQQLIQEVEAVAEKKKYLTKLCKTLEALIQYFIEEQSVSFKYNMESLVRRARVHGVSFLAFDYQRGVNPLPDQSARLADMRDKLGNIAQQIGAEIPQEDDAEAEQLRMAIEDLESTIQSTFREGPVFRFFRADEVIIDKNCTDIKTFEGADFVALQYEMTADEIQSVWSVDVAKGAKAKSSTKVEGSPPIVGSGNPVGSDPAVILGGGGTSRIGDSSSEKYKVYHVYDRTMRKEFVISDCYADFLVPPEDDFLQLERFFPILTLTFNPSNSRELYPLSDVYRLRSMQFQINQNNQARSEQLAASVPAWVAMSSGVSQDQLAQIGDAPAHSVIAIQGPDNSKISDLIQARPSPSYNPGLFETGPDMSNMYIVTGSQEANIGGISGGSATESAIANQSRSDNLRSQADLLDDFLTEFARCMAQIVLTHMDPVSVAEIVGPGAVWVDPVDDVIETYKELAITIKAGSSGQPNAAAESANLERLLPLMLQLENVSPSALVTRLADLMDIEAEDLLDPSQPSQVARNAMQGRLAAGAPNTIQPEQNAQPMREEESRMNRLDTKGIER